MRMWHFDSPLTFPGQPCPQGGRLDVASAFANLHGCQRGVAPKLLISPLAGEMSGRTEGGVKELDISSFGMAASP
ncbi:MAG: hypothetical protein EOQ29_23885 [Mesorhizobium sp.]|nr:MAG: hypothetical protein EOQ29_23885 [Mesorhizobium sp.]